ncbi:MAG TPA: MFS transporter [Polyangiaceae bacterium]
MSLVGTWTQSVAQTWLVYRLTGSALWLGIATFCQQAPVFFLATLVGVLADRHRRRTLLVVTQSSAMALAFALAALRWRVETPASNARSSWLLPLAARQERTKDPVAGAAVPFAASMPRPRRIATESGVSLPRTPASAVP